MDIWKYTWAGEEVKLPTQVKIPPMWMGNRSLEEYQEDIDAITSENAANFKEYAEQYNRQEQEKADLFDKFWLAVFYEMGVDPNHHFASVLRELAIKNCQEGSRLYLNDLFSYAQEHSPFFDEEV